MDQKIIVHPTAEVAKSAKVGSGTKIWHQVQVREDARIGKNCVLGKGVYIDRGVEVEDYVHIQNYSCLYKGVFVARGAFIGAGVLFATDLNPRSLTSCGESKKRSDWIGNSISIKKGASIGSGSVILGDVCIGRFAMIGAGSVVTSDVCDYGLVRGNPARLVGFVCKCGFRSKVDKIAFKSVKMVCLSCKSTFVVKKIFWDMIGDKEEGFVNVSK